MVSSEVLLTCGDVEGMGRLGVDRKDTILGVTEEEVAWDDNAKV